jgi:dTDP-4-amino-4,6-dideoxygalactose transaminase
MVTDRLGPGTIGDDLVNAVSAYLKLPGGIALRERSRALGIALGQLELEAGARVLLDPLVPGSYHELICSMGLIPEYIDTIAGGVTLDPAVVEQRAGEASAIITATHLGYVPEMERIAATGLPIIEDISHGIGANTGEQRVGAFGRYVLIALEPDSIITAGGGTLLLTPIKKERAALRRLAGSLQSDALLPDMNAALGTTQIKEIEKFIARRAEIASVYSRALMRGKHRTIVQPGDAEPVWFSFPVVLTGSTADATRYAKSKDVETAMPFEDSALAAYGKRPEIDDPQSDPDSEDSEHGAYHPSLQLPQIESADYPNANEMALRCIQFPLYPSLSGKEIQIVERVLLSLP